MLKFDIQVSGFDRIQEKLIGALDRSEHIVAIQAAKDTAPFVPMLTGSLTNRTKVEGGDIIYPGPYARYLYFGKVMVDSKSGKGPMHFTDKHGNEVIAFRKGAILRPTNRDLEFNKASHSRAQAHWFEASKSLNMERWQEVARRAAARELK